MTYEIYQPNALDSSEFAGTRSGTWEPATAERFDTAEDAANAIREWQAECPGDDDVAILAVFELGGRYPVEIIHA